MNHLFPALGSALGWGSADFLGGLQSRRLPVLSVALWSQAAGGLSLLLLLIVIGEPRALASVPWGLTAGLCVGVGILFLYRGLAIGVMGVVGPVSACGSIVPVLVGAALGEIPSLLGTIGIVAALGGIVLVSLQPGAIAGSAAAVSARTALGLALGAALGIGLFYVFVDRGIAVEGGSALWTAAAARLSSMATLVAIALVGRRPAPWPGGRIVFVAAAGVLDGAANILFALAAVEGEMGITSVVASLYPIVTLTLGAIFLAERLTRLQASGVTLALLGIALLAAG